MIIKLNSKEKKYKVILSKKDWVAIGKEGGWFRTSQLKPLTMDLVNSMNPKDAFEAIINYRISFGTEQEIIYALYYKAIEDPQNAFYLLKLGNIQPVRPFFIKAIQQALLSNYKKYDLLLNKSFSPPFGRFSRDWSNTITKRDGKGFYLILENIISHFGTDSTTPDEGFELLNRIILEDSELSAKYAVPLVKKLIKYPKIAFELIDQEMLIEEKDLYIDAINSLAKDPGYSNYINKLLENNKITQQDLQKSKNKLNWKNLF